LTKGKGCAKKQNKKEKIFQHKLQLTN